MPQNTKRLVIFLAVFAFFVAGINVYRWVNPIDITNNSENTNQPTIAPLISVTTTPFPTELLFKSPDCGLEMTYPANYTETKDSSGSAILATADGKNAIYITCNELETAPGLASATWRSVTIASVSARLYEQTFDNIPITTLYLKHPKSGQVIYIAGNGDIFNSSIQTIKLY